MRAMSVYDRFVLPRLIDCVCGLGQVMEQRAALIPRARGRVLEVGAGSGLNFRYYDAARVERIHALDPSDGMNKLAVKRARDIGIPVETLSLSAETIAAADASFDTIVSTFTLCTIPDAVAALREMRRVLKPDGALLFCEHGLAPDASVRRWQRRLTPLWKPLAGGCHLNRDMPALLREGGFDIDDVEQQYLRGPKPMMYVYRGSALPSTTGITS
jgi:ubiquinone/menaquinone biosynthesis C-methylase UbiE